MTSVVRGVHVGVDPATAFRMFTDEIGAWYRSGRYSWNDPARAIGIRFDPGPDGRLVEVWDAATGEGYEMGRVLVWEPPTRLVFAFRTVVFPPDVPTEVEVRFEPRDGGTWVTLEHHGLDRLPPDLADRFVANAWKRFMTWYRDYAAHGS